MIRTDQTHESNQGSQVSLGIINKDFDNPNTRNVL